VPPGTRRVCRRVLETLTKHGACSVVDIERHSGIYNAVNLHVGYKIPKDALRQLLPTGYYLNILHFYMPDTIDNIMRAVYTPDELVFDSLPNSAQSAAEPVS
jgi:hypothetical protein